MNHYTDKKGYNAISSQVDWTFKAFQPRALHNPIGAYFTTYPPTEPNLSERIFVPRRKLKYVLGFSGDEGLLPLPGGRGRLKRIFYSPDDYLLASERQREHGETGL